MFYQLFGLILTAPIHCRGSIGEQVMVNFSKSVLMNKLIYILDGLRVSTFSAVFHFWENTPLRLLNSDDFLQRNPAT